MSVGIRAIIGLILVFGFSVLFSVSLIELALFLAIFVWVPVLLHYIVPLSTGISADRWLIQAGRWSLLFAVAGGLAVVLESTILAGIWLVFTLVIGVLGVLRQLRYGLFLSEEMLINLALVYLPVGGGWLVLSVSGASSWLPYSDVIVWLTAVHFHYASFLLLIIAGLYVRHLRQKRSVPIVWPPLASMLAIGPVLIAIGIDQGPPLEFYLVVFYWLALAGFSVWWFIDATRRTDLTGWVRVVMSSAALVFLCTSSFSVLYSYGLYTGTMIVDIPWMVTWHGAINATVFSLLTVLVIWQTHARPDVRTIEVSRLRTRGYVGDKPIQSGDWPAGTHRAKLVHDWHRFVGDLETMHPNIQKFYADPQSYNMHADVQWAGWIRPLKPMVHAITRRMGQLNVPSGRVEMTGRVLPIDPTEDGRLYASAWLRRNAATEEAIFTAVYSMQHRANHSFMNIALPLPFGTMTGILRPANDNTDGFILSSRPVEGEEGIYLTFGRLTVRTPLYETFHVQALEENRLQAKQQLTIFGIRFLTIHYRLHEKRAINASAEEA
ncbi:YndJ family protein [Geomicrobium sp. JCM 19039]|uniref:YndJ family protein n=1 Tax=Geomicrobium sp. JCM 19039 TaxID=1460636 RepID=UPI00045F27EA|nr:YndJ family protein [Geomicrobium sp. JCM 19039]GAK10476.1 hypothetical protein JCM19039_90 [Geomicrobium sp. JCM 19039]